MLKKSFFYLVTLLFAINGFAQSSCVPSGSCTPTGYPAVSYGGCYIYGLLDRYLARSMMFTGLADIVSTPAYCDEINLIKEVQPSYLSRIAGGWGANETQMIPGGSRYIQDQQVISDINKVYCSLDFLYQLLKRVYMKLRHLMLTLLLYHHMF